MEKCQHFTIRGAVAEFRERDWKLNYPFPIHQELNPQQIKSLLSDPLDTPKFKLWCCESCIQNLIDGDCPHLLAKPATSSYNELVTCKASSDADAVIINTSVAIDTDSSALPSTCSNDKYLDEYEGPQTSAIGCSTDSGLLITKKRRVMLDLNEAPPLESSENTFDNASVTEELEFESTKSQIAELSPAHKQHTENTEAPDAFPEAISDMGKSDHCPSLCTETDDSFKDSIDKVSLKRDNPKKKRIQKYRTLSELLDCKSGENSESCQSISSMEIVRAPEPKPFKNSKLQCIEKKKHIGIQVEQGPTLSSTSKDAAGKNFNSRVADFKLPVENNDLLLGDESLQKLRVSLRKRKQRESPARDDTSERGNSCPQNESGNLLLPKKKRILGYEVLKVHGKIDEYIQLKSVAVKRKITPSCTSSHKRSRHDSTGRDANKRTTDKRISKVGNGSVLLGRPNPNLSGMELLSMAAEQTKDLDLLSTNIVCRAIPHLYTVREKINIPKFTTDQLKLDVVPTGGKGHGQCAQATVPSEHELIDEAMKFFMLGPENLTFRSRCISYN